MYSITDDVDLIPLEFCEIVSDECVENIACEIVKVKEKVLLDHTYVASCNADVNKKKKRRIKSKSAKYAFKCVEDHHYMSSNRYVVGLCVAVDTILTIGREFGTWCENDKDIVADYNKIDFNSELILKNALESGNLTVVARKILDSITLKRHIVHQMMASSESNMCSISRRKREPVAYIMKKDACQMKLFSWNDTFMEAYSVMPDLVRLVIAYMIRQFGSSYQDTAVIN